MGWYEAWRLLEDWGAENVPADRKAAALAGEADPARTWASAVNKRENELRLRRERFARRRRIRAIEAEGPC